VVEPVLEPVHIKQRRSHRIYNRIQIRTLDLNIRDGKTE